LKAAGTAPASPAVAAAMGADVKTEGTAKP